jgi:nicotinamide mononucleotide transporter
LVGQYLLAHKRLENWAVWFGVNIVAAGLFAWKGLWLTALLYLVLILLSAVGWRAWAAQLKVQS